MKRKVIVIGGGFGGLTAAIRLANRGFEVDLFEKRDRLGGRAYVYHLNGFTFDGGPNILTAPALFDELFAETGRRREAYFQTVRLDPAYRVFGAAGKTFDFGADPNLILEQVKRLSPADQDGYLKLVAANRAIAESGFFDGGQAHLRAGDVLKVLRRRAYRSVRQHVAGFIQDEFLRQVFSFYPQLVGGSPQDTPGLYAALAPESEVHYALGGTGAIVAGLGQLLQELGGKIYLNTEVGEILIEGRKASGVRLQDNSVHRGDVIVSNADLAWTYKYLLPPRLRRKMTDRRIDRYRYSPSLFGIYFGTRRRYLDAGLVHHNVILEKGYADLAPDLFQGAGRADPLALVLHMPTFTDPGLAPEGCEAFCLLSPVPHLGAPVDWAKIARPYRDRIMAFLEQNYLPDLRANLVAEYVIDPLHFQNTLNSYRGAAYALAPDLSQSAWLRPANRAPDFDHLYFTGAGTQPGAGLAGVLASAKIVEKLVSSQA